MKLSLIFPPPGSLTQPPLGLASLAAFLRHRGFESFEVLESSIGAVDYFLDPGRLAIAGEEIRRKLKRLDRSGAETPSNSQRCLKLASAWLETDEAVEKVTEAKALLRDPEQFYHAGRIADSIRLLTRAFRVLTAQFDPTAYSFSSFAMRHDRYSTAAVIRATEDELENPFLEYFRQAVLPRVVAGRPDVVGISVVFPHQVIPAITLARLVRETLPDAHITIGGPVFTHLRESIGAGHPFFRWIDSFVLLDGESALFALLERLDSGAESLEGLPNLMYQDSSGRVHQPEQLSMERVKELPGPDYTDIDLRQYLVPVPVLPLETTRGCFWNRCAFCNFTSLYERHGVRQPERVLEDISRLKDSTGCRHFALVDETTPPRTLRILAEGLLESGIDVAWYANCRLSGKKLDDDYFATLANSGCRMLYFGLESASERVLALQNKGITPASSSRILKAAHNAGISTMTFLMVGFPTETAEEVRTTLDFVAAHQAWLDWAPRPAPYFLTRNSLIDQDPDRFGIERLVSPDQDLALSYRSRALRGMTDEEVQKIALEGAQFIAGLGYGEEFYGDHLLCLLQEFGGHTRDVLATRQAPFQVTPPRGDLFSTENRPRSTGRILFSGLPEEVGDCLPAPPPGQATTVVYDRQSRTFNGYARQLVILLSLCDGRRDVNALAGMVWGEDGIRRHRSRIISHFEMLLNAGAISF